MHLPDDRIQVKLWRRPTDMIFHDRSRRPIRGSAAMGDDVVSSLKMQSPMNCNTFSTGYSSGECGGSNVKMMWSGIFSLSVYRATLFLPND
ncbi:hypothetical protein AJ87_44205 [Rhizobium yanglingense]|nr:hypothetical protein AJ87_44205 [Rhizobium yanglingense]